MFRFGGSRDLIISVEYQWFLFIELKAKVDAFSPFYDQIKTLGKQLETIRNVAHFLQNKIEREHWNSVVYCQIDFYQEKLNHLSWELLNCAVAIDQISKKKMVSRRWKTILSIVSFSLLITIIYQKYKKH